MLFLFVESPYFSSFWQHMPVVIIAKFPHYSELFTFYMVVIYSGSLFVGPRSCTVGVCQFVGWEHVQILLIKT